MARTIRRKHYIPSWIHEVGFEFIDPATGVATVAGDIQLQGKAKQKRLLWWHAESTKFFQSPPKGFRKKYEVMHRANCREELSRFRKNHEYEVLILPKKPLGYWL